MTHPVQSYRNANCRKIAQRLSPALLSKSIYLAPFSLFSTGNILSCLLILMPHNEFYNFTVFEETHNFITCISPTTSNTCSTQNLKTSSNALMHLEKVAFQRLATSNNPTKTGCRPSIQVSLISLGD